MSKNIPEHIAAKAISLVDGEFRQWNDSTAFITTKIAIKIRSLIELLRKNYFGIFDEPTEPTTGRKKIWIPLTESIVDSIVKNIDLDSKDVNFRAKVPKAIGLTSFVRDLVRNKLDSMGFGDKLDELERYLCIDGSSVWKTYITNDKGKKVVRVKLVDLLNFYIEPTAPSIREASSVIERAVMTVNELKSMDGWENTDDIEGGNVSRNDYQLNNSTEGGEELVEVYERWGLMEKSLLTGKEDDTDLVEGHIVVSGLNGGTVRVHLIEENTNKDSEGNIVKPYEEVRYMKVPGRWLGRGPAEKIMMLQVYMNTIVNIRYVRSLVSQLGIFKIRKGSGVTPQMLSKLSANGAVVVNDINDIQQMVVQEASQASYTDEGNISNWAQRVTSAFESVTGEQLPSSTPATNAVIQNRMAQSQFVMVREGIGLFIQRWMKNHYLPKLAETLTKGEVIRISGEVDELRSMDDKIATGMVMKQAREMMERGEIPTPQQVELERERVKAKLQAQGPERFVEMMKKPDMSEYDVQVYVTNEEVDKSVLVQNLIQVMQIAGQIPGLNVDLSAVARSIFDIMGLDTAPFATKQQTAPANVAAQAVPQGNQQEAPATGKEAATAQALMTAANTAL